jgi:hypothetical protein
MFDIDTKMQRLGMCYAMGLLDDGWGALGNLLWYRPTVSVLVLNRQSTCATWPRAVLLEILVKVRFLSSEDDERTGML